MDVASVFRFDTAGEWSWTGTRKQAGGSPAGSLRSQWKRHPVGARAFSLLAPETFGGIQTTFPAIATQIERIDDVVIRSGVSSR